MKIKTFFKRVIWGFSAFILLSLVVWLIILKMNYVVPILMYHSISEGARPQDRLIVDPKNFDKQMKFLRQHNYNVVYIEEIARMIKEKKKIPPKTVAVTFDDGLMDNYIYAFPIIAKYKIPATIFVVAGCINQKEYMTADQIKLIANMEVDIGSHTLSHMCLIDSDDETEWEREIFQSKKILEQLLGKEVVSFSYPNGNFNDRIKEVVKKAGYKVAVTTSPGRKFPNDDIYALKRVRISNTSTNLLVFWFKLTGSYLFIKEMRDDY